MWAKGSATDVALADLAAPVRNALVGGPFGSDLLASDYTPVGVPVIRGENLAAGRWVQGPYVFVSTAKAAKLAANTAGPLDLVFTQRGANHYRQVGLVPSNAPSRFLISQSQMKLTVDPEKADPLFVYYLFRAPEQQEFLKRNAIQTGVPHTNLSILKRVPLRVPSLSEQRAIASILGTLDDKIELNRRTNETLEARARALFKSWFVDFDPVRAKIAGKQPAGMDAATAALFPSEFVESEIGEIPTGWTTSTVANACELNPPRTLRKGTKAPYVEMSSLPTAGHRPSEWPLRETGSGARFQNGDTLLARITPCLENGKTGYVDFLEDGAVGWGSTEYIVIRPKAPLPTEWGYLLARDPVFRDFATQKMEGTTGRQRVPAQAVGRFMVVVPPATICERFAEFVEPAFHRMAAACSESVALSEARDTLLPRLLSGELRIPDAERFVSAAT